MARVSVFEVATTMVSDVVYFPVWWYSTGLIEASSFSLGILRGYARMLALDVWVKNLFVPMYGQNDWQSRLISFFMRFVQIIGRLFVLVIWAAMVSALFLLYLAAPIILVGLMLYHLVGGLA